MIEETVSAMVVDALDRKREWLVSSQGLLVLVILYVGVLMAKALGQGLRGLSDSVTAGARDIGVQIKYHH